MIEAMMVVEETANCWTLGEAVGRNSLRCGYFFAAAAFGIPVMSSSATL